MTTFRDFNGTPYRPSSTGRYTGRDFNGNLYTFCPSAASLANTVTLMGDSIAVNNWATSGSNYAAVCPAGAVSMANALGGHRLSVENNIAVSSTTALQCLTDQIPLLAASPTKFAFLSTGTNDIYSGSISGAATYQRIIDVIEAMLDIGVIPIWSTIRARATSVLIDDHLYCNDLLKQYAARYNCGVFYDAYMLYQDPTATDGSGRTTFYVDTQTHPNNLGGYYEGKLLSAALTAAGVPKSFTFSHGAEDSTNDSTGRGNLLTNPYFSGTGGTVSANCTGTMPTGWTIAWSTRTGTGSAAASIVNVTDPDTGLAVSKGIQVVLSGTVAAADELLISQTGFHALLSGGDDMSAEGVVTMTSPVAFDRVAMRVQANGTDSTWWGIAHANPSGSGSNGDIPETGTWWLKTRKLAVVADGAASAAAYHLYIRFSGAATGTYVLSRPRVRKG